MSLLREMRIALVIAVVLTVTASARQLSLPAGWKWVADSDVAIGNTLNPPEGKWLFGTMAPGWHITTRPAVALYEPSYAARGRFVIESETFLFPGPSPAGFGVFVGGQNLESKASRYVAFLIRRDGSAGVEVVENGQSTPLSPWVKAASVVAGATDGEAVKNVLRVEGEGAVLSFLVNNVKVAEVPREAVRPDGIVGLRIGADLDLHVTNLDLTHRLALPRPTKPGDN